MYYWRAQIDDGANASEASGASTFEVYTPVEIAAPQIQSPSGGSGGGSGSGTSGGEATTLVITAPVVSGPASNIQWELQVAEDPGFSAVVVSLSGPMPGASVTIDVGSLFSGSSQSLTASSLDTPIRSEQAFARPKGNTQYYWRARVSADGREGTVVGPWSPRRTFTTPTNQNELVSQTPLSPVGGGKASSNPPNLVVRSPSRKNLTGGIIIRYTGGDRRWLPECCGRTRRTDVVRLDHDRSDQGADRQ
jgi:hypothetical protein